MSETFKQWAQHYFTKYELEHEVGGEKYEQLDDVWNHQQKKIDDLEASHKQMIEGAVMNKTKTDKLQETIDDLAKGISFYEDIDYQPVLNKDLSLSEKHLGATARALQDKYPEVFKK